MTAIVYPQWLLDIVAPGQVYPSDAAIMRRAIDLTLAALERGQGGPFGAIIATAQGEIVAVAHNEVRQGLDVTAHAEVVVIRRATQALKHLTLDAAHGAPLSLFTTCEPCAMCVGAIFWARLPTVIAATRKEDAQSAGMRQEFALIFCERRRWRYVECIVVCERLAPSDFRGRHQTGAIGYWHGGLDHGIHHPRSLCPW